MLQIVRTIRDMREYVAAKRRKREPLRFVAKGAGCADYAPRDRLGFSRIRGSLRGVGDWGRASERIDSLEHALRKRTGATLPLPRRLVQNEDRSLSLFYDELSVRAFPDGVAFLVGGSGGHLSQGVKPELLEALAFRARLQSA